MKLRENSWYTWYYRSFYGTCKLPSSFCEFFWKLFFGVLMIPLTSISLIVNYLGYRRDPEDGVNGALGTLFSITSLVIGLVSMTNYFHHQFSPFRIFISFLVGGFILFLAICVILLIIYILYNYDN